VAYLCTNVDDVCLSALAAHKTAIPDNDVSIHVTYSQDDDEDTFEPASTNGRGVATTGNSKVNDQGVDQAAAVESTISPQDEAMADKEPQEGQQKIVGTEEPPTAMPLENKPAEKIDIKPDEQIEQDTKPDRPQVLAQEDEAINQTEEAEEKTSELPSQMAAVDSVEQSDEADKETAEQTTTTTTITITTTTGDKTLSGEVSETANKPED